jgi:hypothetical protein
MKFINLLQNFVGSINKINSSPVDIDIRVFYLNKNKTTFHIKKIDEDNIPLDIDYWEISLVLEQITNGNEGAPFLYNTINSPNYRIPNELGLELIENKDKLIGKPLIDGSLKFCEKKLGLALNKFELPGGKIPVPHKQIYYACSDLLELYYNLTNNITYPFDVGVDILNIKENKMSLNDSIDILNTIKDKIVSLGINYEPDIEWRNNFIDKCYKFYDTQNK